LVSQNVHMYCLQRLTMDSKQLLRAYLFHTIKHLYGSLTALRISLYSEQQ